jgi:hypothetical protein
MPDEMRSFEISGLLVAQTPDEMRSFEISGLLVA